MTAPTPCSEASLACGEPLAGSAGEAHALIAFSWPKPAWHHDKVALSQGAPADLARIEAEHKAAGRKLALRAFQREVAPSTTEVELICVEPASGRSLHLRDVPTAELGARIGGFLAGETSGPALGETLILACTDGRHDRCCAVHGRVMYRALCGAAQRRGASVAVAESSHLGGHRLAATCIALPSARMYGRLDPSDADALIDAVQHDCVYVPRYRGRLGLSELEQVAEAEALARFPEASVRRIRAREDGCVSVTLYGRGGREICTELRFARATFTSAASCTEPDIETRTRWVST